MGTMFLGFNHSLYIESDSPVVIDTIYMLAQNKKYFWQNSFNASETNHMLIITIKGLEIMMLPDRAGVAYSSAHVSLGVLPVKYVLVQSTFQFLL